MKSTDKCLKRLNADINTGEYSVIPRRILLQFQYKKGASTQQSMPCFCEILTYVEAALKFW